MLTAFVLMCSLLVGTAVAQTMPLPFVRILKVATPVLAGKDVTTLQNLLLRSRSTTDLQVTDNYDQQTGDAVSAFQQYVGLPSDGIFGPNTAASVLYHLSADGYDGSFDHPLPANASVLYKVLIPVHQNRSIESIGHLMDPEGVILLNFTARLHGHNDGDGNPLNQVSLCLSIARSLAC